MGIRAMFSGARMAALAILLTAAVCTAFQLSPTGQYASRRLLPTIRDSRATRRGWVGVLAGVKCVDKWWIDKPPPPVRKDREFSLRSMDAGRTKTIHWVRHGKGHHNEAADIFERGSLEWIKALGDMSHFDARLNYLGQAQCGIDLRMNARKIYSSLDLIISSPLTRTLETTTLGFPEAGEIKGGVKILAYECCRERWGRNPCDSRRNISQISMEFPHVDFSMIEDDQDPHLCDLREDGMGCVLREDYESMDERIEAFIKMLGNRPEKNIAVVSHSGFMARLFEHHIGWREENGSFQLKNGEIRSMCIEFADANHYHKTDWADFAQ